MIQISLYKTNLAKYGTEFKNEELNIIELQKDIDFRNHINTWLRSQEQSKKIQSVL
jgi:hypothetical protein